MHWSTQAGTSSSVRDPYPARGLIFHRRPLSGLPPHSCGERRIKRWRDCGRYRHRCRVWHQKQRQSGTEMPKFCLGNYAFFGVGEPAACGAGVVTVPFAVVACCNAFPRPQRDDAERGREQHSQTQIRRSHAMYVLRSDYAGPLPPGVEVNRPLAGYSPLRKLSISRLITGLLSLLLGCNVSGCAL